ncbi:MAG: hypothetical protein JNL09_05815 [Anaerolineales bacterium]|nr:hypothetical protein [Anaerolineales bacterium]
MLAFFVMGAIASEFYKQTKADWLAPLPPFFGGLMFTSMLILSYDSWRFQSQKPMHKDEQITIAVYYLVGAMLAIGVALFSYSRAWQAWIR